MTLRRMLPVYRDDPAVEQGVGEGGLGDGEATATSRMAVYVPTTPRPHRWGEGGLPALRDNAGRAYRYLRLSVTDRCDMACVYCMPPGGEAEHARRRDLLTFEEAARVVRVVADMGIERVRLTGGEPLVRKDIVQLVERIGRVAPGVRLAMTTNAGRLAELARPLYEAGLREVNVSLDSLNAAKFARITRGGELRAVQAGLRAARDVGMGVKLNTVALRGRNDDELGAIVDYAWSLGAVPRFIELMPLGEGAKLPAGTAMSAAEVQATLGARLLGARHPGPGGGDMGGAAWHKGGPANGPARYVQGTEGRRVGFITPISDEFCADCNRIRVTARGDLRACLASRRAVSLRDALRGASDVRQADLDVAWALQSALGGKLDGHGFNDAAEHEHEHVGMSLIGG